MFRGNRMAHRSPARQPQRCRLHLASSGGFGLLGLLILIAILGIVGASGVQVGALMQRRAAEQDLLFVGMEFQRALASYAAASPAGAPRTPKTLEDLLRDPRQPGVRRHLRRIYVDPVTGAARWGLVRGPDGGIVAVHSLSGAAPIKQTGFESGMQHLAERGKYSEWVFGTVPAAPGSQLSQSR